MYMILFRADGKITEMLKQEISSIEEGLSIAKQQTLDRFHKAQLSTKEIREYIDFINEMEVYEYTSPTGIQLFEIECPEEDLLYVITKDRYCVVLDVFRVEEPKRQTFLSKLFH